LFSPRLRVGGVAGQPNAFPSAQPLAQMAWLDYRPLPLDAASTEKKRFRRNVISYAMASAALWSEFVDGTRPLIAISLFFSLGWTWEARWQLPDMGLRTQRKAGLSRRMLALLLELTERM